MNEIPIINDFKNPQLNKTEKAIAMLQAEIDMLKSWNTGLQRQVAGILIGLKVSPKDFVEQTNQMDLINNFLLEAQSTEQEKVTQALKEKEELNKRAEAATGEKIAEMFNENGKTENDKNA